MAIRMFRTKGAWSLHHKRECVTFSMDRPKPITVGIDFGCKNSRVAIIDSLVPKVVSSEIGHFTPSYVTLPELNPYIPFRWTLQHLDIDGTCVSVGEHARRKLWRQPSDVLYNIKKLIGQQFEDSSVQEMRKRVHFSIIEGPRGEAWVGICGRKFSPVDITCAIFQKLRQMVVMDSFHDELQAVISVPVFFNELQKEHIQSAARRAGFELLQSIDEPIAAALSSITIEDGIVVVFGMGAGSYNVTILHVSPDRNIEIRTQFGDTSVGGDQFNEKLTDFVVRQILKLHSVDIRGDRYAMTMLAEAMEKVKVGLSSKSEVTVSIPSFSTSAQAPVDLNITISRLEFENLVDDLIGHIRSKCQSILEDAKICTKDIKEIVLIGGMTRLPKIQGILCEVFGQNLNTKVNPEEAVVLGSAIQGALIVEEEQVITDDMIPLSIGIESSKGIFTKVIPRLSPIPTKQIVKIPSWLAYGERQFVRVFLGEHVLVQHNIPLGEIEIINNQRSFHGCVDIELTFEVDKDYLVKVSARYAGNEVFSSFPITLKDRLKGNVDKAIRKALFDWKMSCAEIRAKMRNQARHITNTLGYLLSARKDEVPEDLCKEAANALVDLLKSLDGDLDVLKHKMLSAKSVESKILNWLPPSELHYSDYSDYE